MAKALIIGGGIAGPVTAVALARAGIESTVYEAYDRTSEGVGAFLTLAVNGLSVLRSVGLGNLLQDKAFATPRVSFQNGNGRRLGELSLGGELPDGTGCQTVSRSDLYIALRDKATERGIRTEYGKRLTAARRTEQGVRAEFADGTHAEADLLRLFGADRTPATRLIEASTNIVRPYSTYYFPSVPTWHRDRMIIIGDAAHATSPAAGQGASMALEDAITLAKCLRDKNSIADSFRAYESLRRERVEAVVQQGKRNGSNKNPGPVARVLRDVFVARAFRKMAAAEEDPQRWMWDHHIDWDAPVSA